MLQQHVFFLPEDRKAFRRGGESMIFLPVLGKAVLQCFVLGLQRRKARGRGGRRLLRGIGLRIFGAQLRMDF